MLGTIFSGITYWIIIGIVAIVNYIFKAIGLYVIAKNKKMDIKWFAFLPFVNNYLLGRLAGETVLINMKIKNSGLMILITELAKFVITTVFYVLYYMPYIQDMLAGAYSLFDLLNGAVEAQDITVGAGLSALQLFTSIFSLSFIFLFISVLITFFRKYAPNNYMAYSIISIFLSIEGIFIFMVRNKKEVNYNEYLKTKYGQFYQNRQNQSQNKNPYNPYNPYNRQNPNPYNQNPNNPYQNNSANNPEKPEEPFKEFSEEKDNDEPFSEIFKSKDKAETKEENKSDTDKKDDDVFH